MHDYANESYKKAGVDISSGYRAVELIKKHIQKTKIPGVIDEIGGFGGLFELQGNYSNPVLVSGTDGVGTKLKIAVLLDRHDTVGIDCVAMCVNDIICAAAKPLFFLDYIALGKNSPEKVEKIVEGVARGCILSECALIGGETAEHPGMMGDNEYDLAGFAAGITERNNIPRSDSVIPGDIIIGIASSGVHSNGFSLTRKVFNLVKNPGVLNETFDDLGRTLGEELLEPTKIYANSVLRLFKEKSIKTACHITGGGFFENIPRSFAGNAGAVIERASLKIPAIFDIIQKMGNIPQKDMFGTYNMGIGMCVISSKENADKAVISLKNSGENAYIIGEIKPGISGVEIK